MPSSQQPYQSSPSFADRGDGQPSSTPRPEWDPQATGPNRPRRGMKGLATIALVALLGAGFGGGYWVGTSTEKAAGVGIPQLGQNSGDGTIGGQGGPMSGTAPSGAPQGGQGSNGSDPGSGSTGSDSGSATDESSTTSS